MLAMKRQENALKKTWGLEQKIAKATKGMPPDRSRRRG
jgi:hypothetical protein